MQLGTIKGKHKTKLITSYKPKMVWGTCPCNVHVSQTLHKANSLQCYYKTVMSLLYEVFGKHELQTLLSKYDITGTCSCVKKPTLQASISVTKGR